VGVAGGSLGSVGGGSVGGTGLLPLVGVVGFEVCRGVGARRLEVSALPEVPAK